MLREIAYREHAKNAFWPMKLEATLGTWHPNEKDVTTLGNGTSKLQISAMDILKEREMLEPFIQITRTKEQARGK